MQTQQTDTTLPKAYLNYLMFDEGFNMLPDLSGAIQVEQANAWQNMDVPQFEIPQNGYLYIFTSNQSQTTVSTDNLYLYHWQSRLLEEFNYYPFGLTFEVTHAQNLQGSDVRYNSQSIERNEFTYNTNAKFGLNWYDFMARSYDVQLGRWMQPDPMMQHASPYLAMSNNPTSFTDPTGLYDLPEFVVHGYTSFEKRMMATFARQVMGSNNYDGSDNGNSKQINYAPNVVNHYRKLDEQNADRAKLNSVVNRGQANSSVVPIHAGFSGTKHLIGPTLILLGQPIKALKPVGALGSAPGSSIASKTLSKVIPQTFTKTLGREVGTKVATNVGTNVIGRALGRLVPYVGWGMAIYDALDNRAVIGEFLEEVRTTNEKNSYRTDGTWSTEWHVR